MIVKAKRILEKMEQKFSADDVYIAIDLGASSGRVLAGKVSENGIALEEIHRFANNPVRVGKRLLWSLLELWAQIELGLSKAAAQYGVNIRSVGVDTWGVDYVLLDKNDDLVGPQFCYRDSKNLGMTELACSILSREAIFSETGLQFMEINTMCQLLALRKEGSSTLDVADRLLMIPDFFHWLLSGQKSNERTNASTTQLLNATTGDWSSRVLSALDIPAKLFAPCVESGTDLGPITSDLATRTGLSTKVRVTVPATHDTAAAVLAVPASEFGAAQPNWCYISSGTWSLMGVELDRPLLNAKCQELNFTNEGGVAGTIRLLKNISGLWPYQQCRAQWQRAGSEYAWGQLTEMAREAKPLQRLFDPDHPSLVAPLNMADEIQKLYSERGYSNTQNHAEIARSALESLAMRYRTCLESLESLLGYSIKTIHIIGGGVQNDLLCQMTASATNRTVVAGPVEATAIGNIMSQCLGTGRLSSVIEARGWLRADSSIRVYEPKSPSEWDDAHSRFLEGAK